MLTRSDAANLEVKVIATDRHLGIAAMCRKDYPEIDHQYDIWHVSKGITKKLVKFGKQKDCMELLPWIKSITNHLWWSSQTCNGNSQLLKEKWLSILHHTANMHTWGGSDLFSECAHSPLTPEKVQETPWLAPDTPPHDALRSVVLDNHLIKALNQMTGFHHTDHLEVFHSVLLSIVQNESISHMRA